MAEAQAGGGDDGYSETSRRKRVASKCVMGEPSLTPCGACKFMRRKCHSGCLFAPFFGTDQGSARFAAVHKVFGASNISKLLSQIPENKRYDAMITISYEAQARLSDPVYGCVSAIIALKQQVESLQGELAMVQNEVMNNRFAYTNVLQNVQQQEERQQQQPNINASMQPAQSSSASTNLMKMSSFNPCFDPAMESTPSSHSFEPLVQFSRFFRDEEDGEEQSMIPPSAQP